MDVRQELLLPAGLRVIACIQSLQCVLVKSYLSVFYIFSSVYMLRCCHIRRFSQVHPPQLQRGFSTPTHAKDMSKSPLTLPNDSQFARLEGSGPDQKLQSRDSMTLNILRETSQRPFPVSNLGGLSDDDTGKQTFILFSILMVYH